MKELSANISEGRYEDILAAVQSPVIVLTELIKNSADSCLNCEDPITVKISTKDKKIEIIDLGEGLCQEEIEHLGEAGYSSKMVDGNVTSPIDNPLSGSKGLGLLTAFFISDSLEIKTYSQKDKKAYFIQWVKGEQKYSYDECEEKLAGTHILLKNIEDEKMKMILLPEEKQKLFMTSLRFFTKNENLPQIKLVIDNQEENYYPVETLESYYCNNKRSNYGFIAKASFKYRDNAIILSYEDNISGFYTFDDYRIDLTDKGSVDKFVSVIKVPEKSNIPPIRKIKESDLFDGTYLSISVPEFSGELYTWRDKKEDYLDQWPVGVRIYVNDYSLYKYLDKDNDWLNLSEISQNVKATNYKLKNTYGYIHIDGYNENQSSLKISKERNDFVDSLAQRKFMKIMREVVMAVFSRIDMQTKNPPIPSLKVRTNNVTVHSDERVDLKKQIVCSNMGLNDIRLEYDTTYLTVDEDWIVSAKKVGSYDIDLYFQESTYKITLNYKEKIPEFYLTKQSIELLEGNTINLRDFIDSSSCKDVTPEDVKISAKDQNTLVKNDLFEKANVCGLHTILYGYGDFQRVLQINIKKIEKQPGNGAPAPRIEELFPQLDLLENKSFKISELVRAISAYYLNAPTLCMAAIRILLESACRAFFEELSGTEIDWSFEGIIDKVLNMRNCSEMDKDYQKYIAIQKPEFIQKFKDISQKYNTALSRDGRKNIKNHLQSIDLNMFIHNPIAFSNDLMVLNTMKIFSPLLNFIFDVLLIKKE